jgi:hypothetical protein
LFPEHKPLMDDVRRVFCGDGTHIRMTDATTNALANFVEENPKAKAPISLKMTSSHLESGSVLLALALLVGKPTDKLPYTYKSRPRPSPFAPLTAEGFVLWRESESTAVQALAPPSAQTLELVGNMAKLPQPSMADLRIRARQLVHPQLDPMELVAAMVHPPDLPPGSPPAFHVFHWQLCCAALVAELKPKEPWDASLRRDVLRTLIFGPPDWTTAAALIVLVEQALDDPCAMEDARDWLDELVQFAPNQGHCPWAKAVAYAHGSLPGLRPDLLSSLEPWLSQGESRENETDSLD